MSAWLPSASIRAGCPRHDGACSDQDRTAKHVGSRTRAPRRASHPTAKAKSVTVQQPQPLAQGSMLSEACAACGSGRGRYRACALSRRSAPISRRVPPPSMPDLCSPGSQPGSSAWLLPACEEKSASRIPIPNLAQNRSCHEKRRSTGIYVIIRDGIPIHQMMWLNA